MKILADRHIPWVDPFFSPFGELSYFEQQPPIDLAQTEGLLLRTTVSVDQALLSKHHPRFIASPTAGTDHVDRSLLADQDIPFFYAPGCNALAVAQWVISALVLTYGGLEPLAGKKLGIVGLGQVGRQLKRLAEILGMEVRANDPPQADLGLGGEWAELHDLLGWCDLVSLHVPWSKTSGHPTAGLIDRRALDCLNDQAVVINSSRGGIIDESALLEQQPRFKGVILDTWAGEPRINRKLLGQVQVASPHIAGYSLEAKWNGTQMIAQQVAEFFGFPVPNPASLIEPLQVSLATGVVPLFGQVSQIPGLDVQLRASNDFARLRNHFSLRHQWSSVIVEDLSQASKTEVCLLEKLGFQLR